MKKICNAEVSQNQYCKTCKWYRINRQESEYYNEPRYSCFATPDIHNNVQWEAKNHGKEN